MRTIFAALAFTLSSSAWGRPIVLVSYFDAFNRSPFNNSERIAHSLQSRLAPQSPYDLRLCALNTVYELAYPQLETCLKALPEVPLLIVSLGESGCEFKAETMMRNRDQSFGPDNAGEERDAVILPEGPDAIGLRYPLQEMYCSLTAQERARVAVSNNAGSFVCNNLGYLMSYHYPELQYGFIHVPSNACPDLEQKSEGALGLLEKLIARAVTYSLEELPGGTPFPHRANLHRLLIYKKDLKRLRIKYRSEECLSEFLRRSKGFDEKGLFDSLKLTN